MDKNKNDSDNSPASNFISIPQTPGLSPSTQSVPKNESKSATNVNIKGSGRAQ